MKYIKKYEYLLKHNDDKVSNNILKPFAENLKKVLLLLKKIDNFKYSSVKIFYDSSGEINIKYHHRYQNLYTFRLLTIKNENDITLQILSKYHKSLDVTDTNNKLLYDTFEKIITKYSTENKLSKMVHTINILDKNNLTILDNIYTDLYNEFELVLSTNKYML